MSETSEISPRNFQKLLQDAHGFHKPLEETTLWIAHWIELSPSSGTDGPTTQLEKTSKSGNIRRNPLIFSYTTCTLQRKAVTLPCFSAQPLQGALKAHQSIRVTSSFGNTN